MDRRKFIKNTAICSGALCLGCGGYVLNENINEKFNTEIYPTSVVIDASSHCNLNCPQCWRNTFPDKEPLEFLKFSNFKKFVDMNPFVKHIDLANSGEMLLNPELDKILKYGAEKNVSLTAETGVNLNYLPDEIAELLVTSKFGKLVLSIDGVSQKVYETYRRGGNINTVMANIAKIQYYQKKHNDFAHPKMIWKYIIFGHNEHEIPKAKELAKKLGIQIDFKVNYTGNFSRIRDFDFVKNTTGLDLKAFRENYQDAMHDLLYEEYKKDPSDWFYCNAFYYQPNIFPDGRLAGCCMANYDESPKINVFETGLIKAINSPQVKKIINVFSLKDSDAKNTLCENCGFYRYIKSRNINMSKEAFEQLKANIKA